MLSYNAKRKLQRKEAREREKLLNEAATLSVDANYFIALYAVKRVFGDRATNKKCEQLCREMMATWDKIVERKVTPALVCESIEAETGIRIDPKTHTMWNTKKKAFIKRKKDESDD